MECRVIKSILLRVLISNNDPVEVFRDLYSFITKCTRITQYELWFSDTNNPGRKNLILLIFHVYKRVRTFEISPIALVLECIGWDTIIHRCHTRYMMRFCVQYLIFMLRAYPENDLTGDILLIGEFSAPRLGRRELLSAIKRTTKYYKLPRSAELENRLLALFRIYN